MLLKALFILPLCAAAAVETYDYIVVGSGPGGGPLAANLARAGHSTLLLEAGSDQGNNPNMTQLSNLLNVWNDPKMAWDFFVRHSNDPTRQSNYNDLVWLQTDGQYYTGLNPPAGAKQLGVWYPRAGTLGGCATHNAAAAVLPADSDWNYIASITGDKSWQAVNMRTYFQKLEKNLYLPNGTPGHGFNGYLNVSQDDSTWGTVDSNAQKMGLLAAQAFDPKVTAATLQSALQKDINAPDPNRDTKGSVYGFAVHANKEGVRATPIDYIRATLADAARFPLTVKTNSLVTKVLFDISVKNGPKGPRAIGVEVLQGESLYAADRRSQASNKGTKQQYIAAKEVIIAGGVFNTPQILKLSGVGPAAELKKFGIPVIKDLPGVGARMSDNYENAIAARASQDFTPAGGRLTMFIRSSPATNLVNIQFFCQDNFRFVGFAPTAPVPIPKSLYDCNIVHMHSNSRAGTVMLKSANPRDTPDINMEYFGQNGDRDLTDMLDAIKWSRKNLYGKATSLQPWTEEYPCINGTIAADGSSSCSDAKQKEWIKSQAWGHHATGSCAIGADNDRYAVLDSQFRVRGVQGLRVVDGSAFPRQPGSFPVLPTFILAEKASAAILG